MKNTLLILFSISWIALVTWVLINLGNSNIPNINFKADNIDLEFKYPMDWQINVQGDLADPASDKYILLDNKIYKASITIHEYYNPDNSSTLCQQYNDCGLSTLHESFLFNKADFQQISNKPDLYISNLGGTNLEWDAESNAVLRSAKPAANNSYHVYIITNGKLEQAILLEQEHGKYIEISYQFNDNNSFEEFSKITNTLKKIISSLEN